MIQLVFPNFSDIISQKVWNEADYLLSLYPKSVSVFLTDSYVEH